MSKKSERLKTVRFILSDIGISSSIIKNSSSSSSSSNDVHCISVPAKTKIGALGEILEEQLNIELPADHVFYQFDTENSSSSSSNSSGDDDDDDGDNRTTKTTTRASLSFRSPADASRSKKSGKRRKRRVLKPNDTVSNSKYRNIDDELIVRISPQLPPLHETMVFGVPIERLAKRPMLSAVNVRSSRSWKRLLLRNHEDQVYHLPEVLSLCFNFLDRSGGIDEVGIFRLSGSVRELRQISRQWNSGIVRDFPPMVDPHVVAGLVKQLLRELPDPLCTAALYDQFLEPFAADDMSVEQRIVRLRELVHKLPRANYVTLEHLMALLHKVSQRSDVNKMGLENLSIVIGPNILRSIQSSEENNESSSISIAQRLVGSATDTPKICQCCSMMIEHYSQIFDNQSPYDQSLPGLNNLPKHLRISSGDNTDHISALKNAASSRKSRLRGNVFHGYIPRSYYEPYHDSSGDELQTTYASYNVRITGESLACLAESTSGESGSVSVQREVPFDAIIQLQDLEEHYVQVDFHTSKTEASSIYISFEDQGAEGRQSWRQHLDAVMKRYDHFKQLAQDEPDVYGASLTREELKSLRKKKLMQQSIVGRERTDSDLSSLSSPRHGEREADKRRIQELEADLAAERQQRQLVEFRLHELQEEIIDLRMQLEVAKHRSMSSTQAERGRTSADFEDSEDEADESEVLLSDEDDEDEDDDYGDESDLDSDSDDSIEFRIWY